MLGVLEKYSELAPKVTLSPSNSKKDLLGHSMAEHNIAPETLTAFEELKEVVSKELQFVFYPPKLPPPPKSRYTYKYERFRLW